MEPLLDSFARLKTIFSDEPTMLLTIDCEVEQANLWIAEQPDEDFREDPPSRRFGDVQSPDYPFAATRSIFDDIDE